MHDAVTGHKGTHDRTDDQRGSHEALWFTHINFGDTSARYVIASQIFDFDASFSNADHNNCAPLHPLSFK